jgi:hypothetical protein
MFAVSINLHSARIFKRCDGASSGCEFETRQQDPYDRWRHFGEQDSLASLCLCSTYRFNHNIIGSSPPGRALSQPWLEKTRIPNNTT